MADFLTAVSTRKVKDIEPVTRKVKVLDIANTVDLDSTASALKALKNQPSRAIINSVLRYLTKDGFSLALPDPLNASIAHQLVNDTIPNYWRALKVATESKFFVQVLRNPTGIGHITTRFRTLITDSRQRKAPDEARNTLEHIEDLLDLTDRVLRDDRTSDLVLNDILAHSKTTIQQKLIWREYLAQTASGRLLSIIAEAEDVLKKNDRLTTISWMADGNDYAAWLGRNITNMMTSKISSKEHLIAITECCSKVLGLGYTGRHAQISHSLELTGKIVLSDVSY